MWLFRSLQLPCMLALAVLQASASNFPRQTTSTSSSTIPSSTSVSTAATSTSSTIGASTTSSIQTSTTTKLAISTTSSSTSTTTQITSFTSPTSTADQITTLDSNGVEVTITVTNSATSTSSTESSTATSGADTSSGLGTGSIIGMSVAGGVALIGIIAFFVWKFTRKRFSDFDDNEAIKWPDLNAHSGGLDSHPLPVHNTGRSGFDTGSESSLSRVNSSNYSTPDFGAARVHQDPYAVPPLPHLNPNQPYKDDPTSASGYYDPYRGPVPGTMEAGIGAGGEWGGEAIPMTQMSAGASDNVQGYATDQIYDLGRQSPGPHAAYGIDQIYEAGRRSPGPQVAYGRSSPGPQPAYGAGRLSPGPHTAYVEGILQAPVVNYDGHGTR